jgi:hypothetical protein
MSRSSGLQGVRGVQEWIARSPIPILVQSCSRLKRRTVCLFELLGFVELLELLSRRPC